MRQTVANILRETAEKHGLKINDLTGQDRFKYIMIPRQEVYFRVFTECQHLSYPEAGRRLGGRDHTTILSGVRKHCQRIGISYDDAKAMRNDYQGIAFSVAANAFGAAMRAARHAV